MATAPLPGTRLATALAAGAIAVGLLAYPLVASGNDRVPAAIVAAIAIGALAGGTVARSSTFVAVGLAAIAAEYLLYLHDAHERLPLATALYAGALLTVAELAFWSISDGTPAAPVQPGAERAATIAATWLAASALAAVTILAARAFTGTSPWLEPIGLTAALALILGSITLARRGR